MKSQYTTAQGKRVSMDSLRLANEDTIAVGNMKVNARGDQLGPGGVPVRTRQQTVNEYYNLHTPVAGARPKYAPQVAEPVQPMDTIPAPPPPPPALDPLIDEQDQIDVVQPEMRGRLADAVARATVVNQELLKPLKQQNRDKGPSRI
jgi:hypothetical protein